MLSKNPDLLGVIAFIIYLSIILGSMWFLIKIETQENKNKPCEYFANKLIEDVPARCLDIYKK